LLTTSKEKSWGIYSPPVIRPFSVIPSEARDLPLLRRDPSALRASG
jgi:hypothetical protein